MSEHDQHYRPAGVAALAAAVETSTFGQELDDTKCWWFAAHGVLIILVRNRSNSGRVRTAYRPAPPGTRRPTQQDFVDEAVRKLADKSSYVIEE